MELLLYIIVKLGEGEEKVSADAGDVFESADAPL